MTYFIRNTEQTGWIVQERFFKIARPRGSPGLPSILVCSLPRCACGKNCSGCYWSHAERSWVRKITGSGKSWAIHILGFSLFLPRTTLSKPELIAAKKWYYRREDSRRPQGKKKLAKGCLFQNWKCLSHKSRQVPCSVPVCTPRECRVFTNKLTLLLSYVCAKCKIVAEGCGDAEVC